MWRYLWFSAPKLKGRPRRKRKKRSASPGESSNESEASVASTSKSTSAITSLVIPTVGRPPLSGIRRSERKTSAEEKKFITDVQSFMNSRGTPVGKMPLLGYRQSQYLVIFPRIFYPMTDLATGRADRFSDFSNFYSRNSGSNLAARLQRAKTAGFPSRKLYITIISCLRL